MRRSANTPAGDTKAFCPRSPGPHDPRRRRYEKKAARVIPVAVLTPTGPGHHQTQSTLFGAARTVSNRTFSPVHIGGYSRDHCRMAGCVLRAAPG
jgi:hypothetical protein